jgi:outer membrane immunogenic protein
MKKSLFAAVCALPLMAGVAFAADLPAAFAPAPVFTWTGLYIGVNGGFGGDQFTYPGSATDIASGTAHVTSSGFVGGGQIGYNWQVSNSFVLGVEADIDYSSIKGDVGLSGAIGPDSFSLTGGSQLNYLGTVRGRLGYAFGRALIYATGGFAYAGEKSFASGSLTGLGSFDVSKSSSAEGWTVGAGAEYALTDNWTVKAEYLYVKLDNVNLLNTTFGGTPVVISESSTNNIVRVGANYKF